MSVAFKVFLIITGYLLGAYVTFIFSLYLDRKSGWSADCLYKDPELPYFFVICLFLWLLILPMGLGYEFCVKLKVLSIAIVETLMSFRKDKK